MSGVETRHARSCRTRTGGRCDCEPTYRASVWTGEKRIRYASSSRVEAERWRKDAVVAIRRGRTVETMSGTLQAVAEEWLEGAKSGLIRTRSGDVYKPSAVRGYAQSLRLRVFPTLGAEPMKDIRRADLQELVDRDCAKGLSASTVQMTIVPLKSIWRREISRDRLRENPTTNLALPAVRGGRDRIATSTEAAALLAALTEADAPIWATATYAGLRRGELKALTVDRIDLKAGLIRVERGWDDKEGEIETKGRNCRRVPIPAVLREHLLGHLMRSGRRDDDLAFGKTATEPFDYRRLTQRADEAWEAAGLKRITLHECRHTFASLMIAAGANAKALQTYMGHASIVTTYDKYGHLMPGNEAEAAQLLDDYLERAV